MRVLHVLDTLDRHCGLFSMTLPGFLAALGEQGIDCDVAAGGSHDHDAREALPADTIAIVDEDDRALATSRITPLVMAADVVHIHAAGAEVSRLAAAVARASATPYVVSNHGQMLEDVQKRRHLSLWMENRAFAKHYRSAARLLCGSEYEERLMRARGVKGRFAILPIGFDCDEVLDEPDQDCTAPPLTLPWNDDKRVIAYFGDIDGRLGLAQFFKACDDLEDELENWRIIVAGRPIDNWLEHCQAGVRRHGKEHLAEFVVQPDARQQAVVLRLAEFVVLPSPVPAPPIAAMWAMSAGKPALVSNAAGLPSVQESGAGIVVEPTRKGILAGLEQMVSASSEQLRERGQAAAELARREFSWFNFIRQYHDLYQTLSIDDWCVQGT